MAKPLTAPGERAIRLPRVRDYQREVYESPARFKGLICGRRWGKSSVDLVCALDGHGPERGHFRGALQGARIIWVVPAETHPSATEAWANLKVACWDARISGSEEHKFVVLPGGGSVQMWSAHDPDTLRGPFADGAIVDECSLQDPRVWAALRPMLSDYGGWAVLSGTVPADVIGHWFVHLYHWSEQPAARARGWQFWRRPAWDNPQLGEDDLAEARETLGTRVYLREYGAELVGVEGGVWREAWFRTWQEVPKGITRMVVTLDAAWKTGVRNDYSSAQCWARTATDYYLLDELHGRWESPELRRRVADFRERWVPSAAERGLALPLYVESVGGGLVSVQEFRAAVEFPVLEYEVRGQTKIARNEAVSPLAESGKVWLPAPSRAPWIGGYVGELVGFPDLPHDDRCDATAMALQVLRTSAPAARAILRPVAEPLVQRGGYA